MDLELELTDGKYVRVGMGHEESRECFKLPAFDVNFEDINECVTLKLANQISVYLVFGTLVCQEWSEIYVPLCFISESSVQNLA